MLLVVSACGGPDEKEAYQTDKIVGGTATTIEAHPWQVSIQTSYGSHFCGGAIIDASWILTTNHCVSGWSASSIRVLAGVTKRSQSSSGQIKSVAEIVRYPGFYYTEDGRNAALLRLSSPLDLSGSSARAIAIATPADMVTGIADPGVEATVTGWGTVSYYSSTLQDTLQAVGVPIVSNDDAEAAYNYRITDDQIAAGVMGVGGRDSCQGDGGGPLTVPDAAGTDRLLVGLVAWGFGCGDEDYPGMYSRVSEFASWIQEHVTLNAAPTVSITGPTNSGVVSGQVTVSADASDANGSVDRVRFILPDGSSVEDSSAPFSITWDSTQHGDGMVTLRAVAIDNQGSSSSESAIQVIILNFNTCIGRTFTSGDTPMNIPDNNSGGVTSSVQATGGGNVSLMFLSLDIRHTWRGDLVVTLVAPNGDSFVVSNRAGGSADDLLIFGMPVDEFDGLAASGTWSLKVQDLAAQDVGELRSWSLTIVGNCNGTGPWMGSISLTLPTIDNGVVCSTLMVPTTGDASAVKLSISGQHDYRSILRGTLSHDGTTVDAFDTGTFYSGSGIFRFTNLPVDDFFGNAFGEWTLCIYDTDGYGDTGMLTSWSVQN